METALLGALISVLGFGTANIVIKKALYDTSIIQTLLGSMMSGMVFLALLVQYNGGLIFDSNVILLAAIYSIGEVFLYFTLYKAFAAADVSIATGILSTYPILSLLITVFLFGESISPIKVLLVLLLVVGAIFIGIDWDSVKTKKIKASISKTALIWSMICLSAHAIYFPALGKFTESGDWETKLLFIKIFAVLTLLAYTLIRKPKFVLNKSKVMAGTLLGFLEVMGWVGLSFASSNTSGMLGVIIALGSSAPLITAIIARIYLKEKLDFMQYVGIAVVVTGISLMSMT